MASQLVVLVALIGVSTVRAFQLYPCNVDSECPTGVACISNYCTCPYEAQIVQNNNCVFPAGDKCNTTLECVDGAACNTSSSTCECNNDRKEQEYTGLCLQLENGPCVGTNDCADNLGLECLIDANDPQSSGKCTCTYFGYPGVCFKTNGSPCTKTWQCTQSPTNVELQCVDGVCTCPWGKEYKSLMMASTTSVGDCKIPNDRRCNQGHDYQCATNRCGSNYRCSCGKGATYDDTKMTCECQNGEVYNWQYQKCICYGRNFGHSSCECPGDLAPDVNSFSCSCPPGAMQMPDNTCMCPVPAVFNPDTKMCEY